MIFKPNYISTAELAKFLGISQVAVCKRIKNGQIKAVKIGRSYGIPESYVQEHFPEYQSHKLEIDEYISLMEAASLLGITRMAVYNRVKQGKIPAKRVGRHYVVAREHVEQALKTKRDPQTHLEKEYLSVSEAAQVLGISRVAVFKQIKRKTLPAQKVGAYYLIARSDLPQVGKDFVRSGIAQQEYISIKEAAKLLGVSRIAVFKRIKRGTLNAVQIGRGWMIERKDIQGEQDE